MEEMSNQFKAMEEATNAYIDKNMFYTIYDAMHTSLIRSSYYSFKKMFQSPDYYEGYNTWNQYIDYTKQKADYESQVETIESKRIQELINKMESDKNKLGIKFVPP